MAWGDLVRRMALIRSSWSVEKEVAESDAFRYMQVVCGRVLDGRAKGKIMEMEMEMEGGIGQGQGYLEASKCKCKPGRV